MRPIQQSITGVGVGPWIPVDRTMAHFAVGYGVRVSGTVTYSVEYTYEDVLKGAVPSVTFTAQTAQTTNKDGGFTQPISAIRLNVTAGTGTAVMDVLQGQGG